MRFMKTAAHHLVLASQSPRRSELLTQAGFEFTVAPTQISEIPDENLNLMEQISDLARRKAEECLKSGKLTKQLGNLILSADTVVVLDGQILGKPKDRPENEQYLRRLMGEAHRVISGICLLDVDSGIQATGCEVSEVTFRQLSETEIASFVDSGEGLDKAGGYGIQGLAGNFVSKLKGPRDNVVGLPIQLLEKLLKENGWNVDRRKS